MVAFVPHRIIQDPCIVYTYIYHKNQLNVGKYTLHGSYGYSLLTCSVLSTVFCSS